MSNIAQHQEPDLATPADFRAWIARVQTPLYVLAPEVGVHPTRLGAMLRGRVPMPADVADRLRTALGK
jgi:plasmid maintenance system antidote protein VapI